MKSGADGQSPATSQDAETGRGAWVTPAVSYVDPVRRFCAFCGRPIARRYWRLPTESGPLVFCEPAHAAWCEHDISQEHSPTGPGSEGVEGDEV